MALFRGTLVKIIKFVFALSVGLLFACNCTAAYNILTFTSSRNSWVGEGRSWSFSADNGYGLDGSRFYSGDPNNFYPTGALYFSPTQNGVETSWEIDFIGPNNSVPLVGTYNATRYPFQGNNAGMALLGNGRADNTLTGNFTVLEASYSRFGDLISFAADFTQYDEGKADEWEQGSVRFNSSIPVPEPLTFILAALGLLGLIFMVRRRSVGGSAILRLFPSTPPQHHASQRR